MVLYANGLVFLPFPVLLLTLSDWPRDTIIVSKVRVHLTGYPERGKLAKVIWKAEKLNMIVTLCPTVWNRIGKLWQKYTIPAVLGPRRVFETVKRFLFHQLAEWKQLREIQPDIYRIYGYKLTIARLKYWIVRRKRGREP